MKKYRSMSDADVIGYAQRGEEEALEELLGRYKGMVLKKASLYYIPGGDREDLIQEGMIGLFQAISGYSADRGGSFSAFAGVCIERHIGMAVRKAASEKNSPLNSSVSIEGEESKAKEASAGSPESIIIDRENAASIENRLRQHLSNLEIEVFELMIMGEKYTDIADKLGISRKSADNAVQRVKNKMKMLIEV